MDACQIRGLRVRLNDLLNLEGTTQFVAEDTEMEHVRVDRLIRLGMPWPLITISDGEPPVWSAVLTNDQLSHLRQLIAWVQPPSPPARENRFLERTHTPEEEQAYFARLAPLLGMTEGEVQDLTNKARFQAYGSETGTLPPERELDASEEFSLILAALKRRLRNHTEKVADITGESEETVELVHWALRNYVGRIYDLASPLTEGSAEGQRP